MSGVASLFVFVCQIWNTNTLTKGKWKIFPEMQMWYRPHNIYTRKSA